MRVPPFVDTSTDSDGDGVPNATDQCPTRLETTNGYKDADGCPDEAPVPKPAVNSISCVATSPTEASCSASVSGDYVKAEWWTTKGDVAQGLTYERRFRPTAESTLGLAALRSAIRRTRLSRRSSLAPLIQTVTASLTPTTSVQRNLRRRTATRIPMAARTRRPLRTLMVMAFPTRRTNVQANLRRTTATTRPTVVPIRRRLRTLTVTISLKSQATSVQANLRRTTATKIPTAVPIPLQRSPKRELEPSKHGLETILLRTPVCGYAAFLPYHSDGSRVFSDSDRITSHICRRTYGFL